MSINDEKDQLPTSISDSLIEETNWIDEDDLETVSSPKTSTPQANTQQSLAKTTETVILVETAFLASTASLIWLINYYFPLGPLLKIFFPIPIALVYLRRGVRASWMAALVSGLLLSVLMGPTRSIVFLMPYGLMGVQLGACWRRGINWEFSMMIGTLIGTFGLFFRFWLFSILLGEDIWVYVITQITELTDWIFVRLGLLAQPSFLLIQILALIVILINNLVYLFAVHLVALILLDRLGNPISRPPKWVQTLLDY